MEDSNGDAPEKNIFGESIDKTNEPHEANIFEQAAAERGEAPEAPHEANIFEQAATEPVPVAKPEPEPVAEPAPEPTPAPEPVQNVTPVVDVPVAQPLSNETPTPKKKKSKKWLVILIIILLIAATGVAVFFIFFNKGEVKAAEHDKKEPILEAFTTIAKLDMDFEAGQISADEYFKQLTYSEYESDKLDEKYIPDEAAVAPINNVDELLDFYEKYRTEISKTSLETFANHYLMNDVALWSEDDKTVSATGVVLADEKKENYIHRLDKVVLSSDGHFLIWYTKEGDDAITDAQAKDLAANMEKNISKYTELTGSPYEFHPISTSEIEDASDKEKANKTLKENNISTSYLENAMSIYVMDTGSELTLATYYSIKCQSGSDLKCSLAIGLGKLIDDFGYNESIIWPHVVVNNKIYKEEDGDVVGEQTINHELFHHYQKIICSTGNKKIYGYCSEEPYEYGEAMANLASALVTNKKGSMLSGWSWSYATKARNGLRHIESDSGVRGYGQYPYFYSYQKILDNGFATLVEAHKQSDPYGYIQEHTSASDMQKVINDAAYRAISGDYDNRALEQDRGTVIFENDGDYSFDLDYEIKDGATMYFTLGKDWKFEFSGKDKISALVIKKKGDKWSIEDTATGKLAKKSTDYSDFDEIYLAVTNADILNSSSFHLKFELAEAPDTLVFNHKYDNYAVDLTMDMEVAGIKVHETGKGVVDERHQREYFQATATTLMNMEITMVMYSDFYNGVDYYSNPASGFGGSLGDIINLFGGEEEIPSWYKSKTASHTIDIDFIVKRLIKSDGVKEAGNGHYKIKMTAAELADLMSTANNSSEDADYKILNGEVEVDVYIDSYGRINKLDYDFSGLVSGIDKFTCSMTLSKYNEAGDVIIPPSIKANAQDSE